MSVPPNTPCPECGKPRPSGAADGLCPHCLLRLGELDAGTEEPHQEFVQSLSEERVGERIGRYRLLEQIGEGGYGTVWMADQFEPVRRRVALKVIKLGMDTKQVVARFEAERQALALMDHQNIARVFDGGTTDTGRPFFVMELVRGLPLTTYCDTAKLNVRERVGLFIEVCQAVQHAHQKGIIHRDLKPSNVLVTEQDGKPLPKVIDFGIARATDVQLTEKTLFTRFNQMIGTPAYMSPEQAGLGSLDIDTRTDIYSLGVLLYELLTGRTPLNPQKLRSSGLDAILKSVREVEAPRPSTRLSTMALEELATVAVQRREAPERLVRAMHGDLDWIALKALEKDRTRRYASAQDLAADLQRFLNNEPIVARPPSNLYRLQKLARRNKLAFAAGGAVLAALIVGLIATSWQWVSATRYLRQARVNAYVSDVGLAQQALEVDNLDRALELLDRQRPESGEKEDFRGFEWRYLWQLTRGAEIATVPGGANDVEFSPDGRLFAVTGPTNIFIYESDSRTVVTNLPGTAVSLSFSLRDQLLAAGDWRKVTVWSTETWRPVQVLTNAGFPAVFSPDGAWLVTGDPTTQPDPKRRLWRTDTWESVASCPATPEYPWQVRNAVAFSPDGSLLATPWLKVSEGVCSLRFWKLPTLEPAETIEDGDIPVWSVAFLPDGQRLLIGTFYGDLIVWDLERRAVAQTIKVLTGSLTTISVAPAANIFVTTGNAQSVRLWDAASLKELKQFRGDSSATWASSITPDGRLLATASGNTAKLWDGTARESSSRFPQGSLIAGFTQDSRTLVLAPHEGDYRWHLLGPAHSHLTIEVPTNPPIRLDLIGKPSDVFGNEPMGALGRSDGTVELWNLATGERTAAWRDDTNEITAVSFSPEGDLLATGDSQGQVHLRKTRTQEKLPSSKLYEDPGGVRAVSRLEFSPNGQVLAGGHWPSDGLGDVVLWDLKSGKRRTLTSPGPDVTTLAFSPDGRLLAAGNSSSHVYVWDLPSGSRHEPIRSHVTMCVDLAFSPDGKTLALGGYEAVKLWNVATEQQVASLPMDRGVFRSLDFSPDGRTLALGYEGFPGHFVRLFQAPLIDEIDAAETSAITKGIR